MRALHSSILAAVLSPAASLLLAQQAHLTVQVSNGLDLARPVETIELSSKQLSTAFRAEDLARVHVTEGTTSRELLAQAVDLDGDGVPDQLVFQAGFEPKGTRTFTLTLGEKAALKAQDFRVYGRFVRERFDDFAWENDLVAHRLYGPALETWQKEPLTSSGVDVWAKKTRALVVNEWYMVDDYHRDHGEGGDFYSVGPSRGCGGTGVWKDGRLFVSRNFRRSRVLANGPVRLVFELEYEPWEAGGVSVSERKRVVLDAGTRFNRFESTFASVQPAELAAAIGIKKPSGASVLVTRELGALRTWEALKEPNGNLGCAVILPPSVIDSATEAEGNVLLLAKVQTGQSVTYLAGSAWDRSEDVPSAVAWDRIVIDQARRLASPLAVEVLPR